MPLITVTQLVVLEPDMKDEYMWWVDREVMQWTPHELAQEFPYMIEFVEKEIDYLREMYNFYNELSPEIRVQFEYSWKIYSYLKRIESLETYLMWIKNTRMMDGAEKRKQNFQERVLLARRYPIDQLIEILPGDKAYCPYHNENTPSVKIYRKQNTGWAYCCQKYVGPIDIVMEKARCGFKEAVIRLT